MFSLQGIDIDIPVNFLHVIDLIHIDSIFYRVNFRGTNIGESWALARADRLPMLLHSLNIFLYEFELKILCGRVTEITRPLSSPYELTYINNIYPGDVVFQKFDGALIANRVVDILQMDSAFYVQFDFREGMYIPFGTEIWRLTK